MRVKRSWMRKTMALFFALLLIAVGGVTNAIRAHAQDAPTVLEPDNVQGPIRVIDQWPPIRMRAAVDSDVNDFFVRIDLKNEVNLAEHIKDGRIIFSSRLGSNDKLGVSVVPVDHILNMGGTDFSFLLTEGKTELQSMGYVIQGEKEEGSHFSDYSGQTLGIYAVGESKKPGMVDFTATVKYAQGGTMILPMKLKVLPKFFISKDLKIIGNTSHPALDFTFGFEPKDGAPDLNLDPIKLSYSAEESGIKTTDDIIELIEGKQPFTASGEYTYTLTETETNYSKHNGDDYVDELVQSKAKYEVTFTVESKPQSDGYRILSVQVKKMTNDNATAATGEKVENYYEEGKDNDIRFTNEYRKEVKEHTEDKPLQGRGLFLSKEVTGTLGDKNQYFPFTVTLEAPEGITPAVQDGNPISFKTRARIWNDRTKKFEKDLTKNGLAGDTNGYFDVTYGEELKASLKHGQAIVFEKVYVGSTFKAQETDAKGHKETYKYTSGGTEVNGATSISVSDQGINKIEVKNDKGSIAPPTGLHTNSSSFMLMILVGVVGVLALLFVAMKKKKTNR